MSSLRVALELARADFLERSRRPAFLLTLGAAAGLAYTVHADVWTVLVGSAMPAPGPATTGTLVAVVTSLFLSLVAFYLVRGTVERDVRTGVGPILTATPAGRLPYAASKVASNAAVLGSMLLVLAGLALAIEAHRAGGISPAGAWQVVGPSLLITGPCLVAVASVAVLFDIVPWLRGTVGNVTYFFVWTAVLTFSGFDTGTAWMDVTGINLVFEALRKGLQSAHPGAVAGGLSVSVSPSMGQDVLLFDWSGLEWTLGRAARRLYWVGVAIAATVAAALSLRLFDPFGDRASAAAGGEGDSESSVDTTDAGAVSAATPPASSDKPDRISAPDLSPPETAGAAVALLRSTRGELRLLLSGHAWWWYLGLAGANVAALFVPADAVATLLLAAWLLPLSAWSTLGCRERLHGTEPLLFSGPSPRGRQLPAQLLAGIAVAVLAASAPLLRMAASADGASLAAAGAGALFVPALALCLGTWTGKEKTFQAIYLALWYVGPANGVAAMDFMGVTGRAVEAGATGITLAAAGALAALAWVGRGRRLRLAA